MKTTPSGTIKLLALAALSVGVLVSLRALAQSPAPASRADPDIDKFVLIIKKNPQEYASLKDGSRPGEAKFILLTCDDNRRYDNTRKLHFKSGHGSDEFDLPGDCTRARSAIPSTQLDIKTDRIIASDAAKRIQAGESTPIGDPHVTIQIASPSAADITAVLDSLQ